MDSGDQINHKFEVKEEIYKAVDTNITFEFKISDVEIPDRLLDFSQPEICLYLFTQDNEDNSSILNKWKVYFKNNNNNITFEIQSDRYAFLREFESRIQIENLKIGLNYLVKCEDKKCFRTFIFNRGLNNSFEPTYHWSVIKCHYCEKKIQHFVRRKFNILQALFRLF